MPNLLYCSLGLSAVSVLLLLVVLFKTFKKTSAENKSLFDSFLRENWASEKRLLDELSRSRQENDNKLENIRSSLGESLKVMREDNSKSIETIRTTVEEKLQGTLETKLTESFGLVSERLEQVYKGLGEMQTLASGVGDLKKVLSNVKTRGILGEVQLENILEQVMAPEQYVKNFSPKNGREAVEFAVLLPGRDETGEDNILLPIDAKFPLSNYQKLVEAQEKADKTEVDALSKALDADIMKSAKDIHDKYIFPPVTTDFALLFLPVEGLFAEIVRKPGLIEKIQRENHIVVAGPTTLWAILSSLQMGFRTLAIQKRSSEVWHLLSAVKTEWTKYNDVLNKIQNKLDEASNSVSEAEKRTRAIGRKLTKVQELPVKEADDVLEIDR